MRYLKLYLYFLRFSFSKALEFRVDFFFRVFMDILFYAMQFMFFNIIYLHTSVFAGWDIEQMRIFVASFIFIDALHMTVFANNCWWLPIYINRGDLDYYLTKPVSTLFFMSLREFAANSFLNLLIAIALLSTIIWQAELNLSLLNITIYILLLLNGTFLYYLVNLLFLIVVFWTQSPRGFGDLFFSISHTVERPDKIFSGITRKIFIYVLPFSLMASYPARYLLDGGDYKIIITSLSISAIFFALVLLIWSKGLKSYSSASS